MGSPDLCSFDLTRFNAVYFKRRHETHFLRFFRKRTSALLMTNMDHVRHPDYAPRENPAVDILSLHRTHWTGHYQMFVQAFWAEPTRVIFESEPVPSFGPPHPGDKDEVTLDALRTAVWERALSGSGWVAQNDISFGWAPQCAMGRYGERRNAAYDLIGFAARFFNGSGVRFWNMAPHGELSSTGVCLAQPGVAYVVYAPTGGPIQMDLSATLGRFGGQWLNPRDGHRHATATVEGGQPGHFTVRTPKTGCFG